MPNSTTRAAPSQQLAYLPNADAEPIAETLTALANADGGTLVVGLYPNGKFGDVYTADEVSDALQGALRLVQPTVHYEWEQTEEDGGAAIVTLRVSRSDKMHTMVDGRVLVRKGAENLPADSDALTNLVAQRPSGDFETQIVAGAQRDDLDEGVIDEYIEKRQARSPRQRVITKERLLQQIGALVDEQPTVNGLLLFGSEPQYFLPQSRAVFVKFADVGPRNPEGGFGYGRREEITGPLPQVIDRIYRLCWEEMDKHSVMDGLQRKEETEYPLTVVREALVNAFAHRDYKIGGSCVEIRLYTDRLEITSPGGLPAHITLDNMIDEHYSRNPRIVNGLYQWGYIEELGLGVDRMIEDMVSGGHKPPVFEAKSHRFTVKLLARADRVSTRVVAPDIAADANERQMRALQYVNQNGTITNREYRQLCTDVGAETLRLDLVDLVTKGVLLKIGDKRGTRYILK